MNSYLNSFYFGEYSHTHHTAGAHILKQQVVHHLAQQHCK